MDHSLAKILDVSQSDKEMCDVVFNQLCRSISDLYGVSKIANRDCFGGFYENKLGYIITRKNLTTMNLCMLMLSSVDDDIKKWVLTSFKENKLDYIKVTYSHSDNGYDIYNWEVGFENDKVKRSFRERRTVEENN